MGKRKNDNKSVARERMDKLFTMAGEKMQKDASLAKRYTTLARSISKKYNVPIPRKFRRMFCKRCGNIFIPSKTCSIRTKEGHIVYRCFSCKNISRFVYR